MHETQYLPSMQGVGICISCMGCHMPGDFRRRKIRLSQIKNDSTPWLAITSQWLVTSTRCFSQKTEHLRDWCQVKIRNDSDPKAFYPKKKRSSQRIEVSFAPGLRQAHLTLDQPYPPQFFVKVWKSFQISVLLLRNPISNPYSDSHFIIHRRFIISNQNHSQLYNQDCIPSSSTKNRRRRRRKCRTRREEENVEQEEKKYGSCFCCHSR